MKVSIVKCPDYEQKNIDESIKKAVNHLGGFEKFIKKGDKVLIKPNLLAGKAPEKAVTTHPSLVSAVIKFVKKQGGKPYVGDSPGGATPSREAAKKAGFIEACKNQGAEFIDLSKPMVVKNPNAEKYKNMVLAERLSEMDLVINMPKLKTHALTVMTGAVKNLFGLIPGKRKAQLHLKYSSNLDFSDMLLDIYLYVKPELTIMDAVVGMQGAGPSNGSPIQTSLIIAGEDALGVDYYASMAAGIEHTRIPTMVRAKKRGMLEKKFLLKGEKIKNIRVKYELPHQVGLEVLPDFIKKFFYDKIIPYPKIKPNCVGCSVCAKNCPAETITIRNKKAMIDYSNCISCFCCQELCPYAAIDVKESAFSKLFNFGVKIFHRR
ncbi:DUF362 domain-containing protein [Candidatus Woesearchaeota archaeon]|nr:DUF362 domain-containing protein [Candidatus Woesearchaeota archaeon]